MVLLKYAFLATLISYSASATDIVDEDDAVCPHGWLANRWHGLRCCPGGMVIDGPGVAGGYCCVEDMRFYKEALTNSALLYQTATTTDDNMDWTKSGGDTCFATVRFNASDYSAQVSTALSKAEATPTDGSNTKATATGMTSSGSRSGSQAASRTGSGSGTATATATATETANAGVLVGPAEGVLLSGVVVAMGAFML